MRSPLTVMRALRDTIALGCLLLGACTAPTVAEVEEVPQRHRALTDEYIVFDNASEIAADLILEQVTRDPNAVPTKVQFNLRNMTDEPRDFMYRVLWLDQHGIEISHSTEGWIRKTILGQQRMNLVAAAPSPAGVDYRLVLSNWQR